MRKEKRKNRVIVAMSGGVDSSVVAALLKDSRVDLVGVFMKFWHESLRDSPLINADSNPDLRGFENRCCSPEAEKRARKVAQILKIPFYVLNFEKEFKKKVVDYFLNGYKKGRTPNPCVVCNKEIKFGLLIKKALALGGDFIATGHYARLRREIRNSKFEIRKLLRARDKEKDQSYFLWQLSQAQLKHILFPIGNYTKKEVRTLAKKFKLPVLNIPESQEICFIPNANLSEFLKSRIKANKGKIVTTQGKIIGEHQGLFFYTIGQRKGLDIPGGPWYVLAKDSKRNVLVVTKNEKDLEKKELVAEKVNWISGKEPELPLKIKAKIRYRHKSSPAVIYHLKPNTYHLKFARPQRAITPGQSVVFFKNQEVLGGGIIC